MEPSAEDRALRRSFDAVAEAYARDFADELARKPFDRELLASFAGRAGSRHLLDIGCGPGQVGAFVASHGPHVTGVDFSDRALAQGAALFPRLGLVCANFRALPFPTGSVDGIVAFYCLIFGRDDDVATTLHEWRRVLRADAGLLVAVHSGEGKEHFADFHGIPVDITIRWRDPEPFARLVAGTGFRVDEVTVRDPYPGEHPSRRIYVVATAV